jgi:hypothetical protein
MLPTLVVNRYIVISSVTAHTRTPWMMPSPRAGAPDKRAAT